MIFIFAMRKMRFEHVFVQKISTGNWFCKSVLSEFVGQHANKLSLGNSLSDIWMMATISESCPNSIRFNLLLCRSENKCAHRKIFRKLHSGILHYSMNNGIMNWINAHVMTEQYFQQYDEYIVYAIDWYILTDPKTKSRIECISKFENVWIFGMIFHS